MQIDKDLVAASSTPLVLAILAEGESYGYAILKRVRELSDGEIEWTDGMLHPLLHRLYRLGYVTREWRTPPEGRRRRYYTITEDGLAALADHERQWVTVARALGTTGAARTSCRPCPGGRERGGPGVGDRGVARLTGLTAGILEPAGIDPERIFEWVLPSGAAGAVVVAAWLVESKQRVIENMAPVLTMVFTPLFALMLTIAAVVYAFTGLSGVFQRELLTSSARTDRCSGC